jgi:hypothetical protein
LARAKAALRAGGRLVVEDIDIEGRFSDPPCAALDRADVLYIEAVRRQGGDPLIGRRLHRLVEGAGFEGVQIGLVQPFARQGSAKQTAILTLAAIAGSLTAAGIAAREEVEALLRDVEAFASRLDTTVSMPRIFQTLATRP